MDTVQDDGSGARSRGRLSADFAWSFVIQVCSSGANFGVTVLAARVLGPSGVGLIYVGFVAYQLILGLQRAVVTQPLVADASARGGPERRRLTGDGATATLLVGAAVTVGFAIAALAVPGAIGDSLVLFTPWVAVALLHDFLKSVLFQEHLARAAAISEGVRFVVFLLAIPLAAASGDDLAVVAAWGIGYLPGIAVALVALKPRLGTPRTAVAWFRDHAWRLGRWLGARELVYQVAAYVTVLSLAVIIGTGDLGGLRAAETIFSPFSFVAAALVLPALPALTRALVVSRVNARDFAVRISAFAVVGCLVYAAVMVVAGSWLLTTLFGSEFETYDPLVWPFEVSQLALALAMPFSVLLMAERRGGDVFAVGLVLSAATLVFPISFAAVWGVDGAAWGMAVAAIVASLATAGLGWVERRPRPSVV